jgi:hypothetical protein
VTFLVIVFHNGTHRLQQRQQEFFLIGVVLKCKGEFFFCGRILRNVFASSNNSVGGARTISSSLMFVLTSSFIIKILSYILNTLFSASDLAPFLLG